MRRNELSDVWQGYNNASPNDLHEYRGTLQPIIATAQSTSTHRSEDHVRKKINTNLQTKGVHINSVKLAVNNMSAFTIKQLYNAAKDIANCK